MTFQEMFKEFLTLRQKEKNRENLEPRERHFLDTFKRHSSLDQSQKDIFTKAVNEDMADYDKHSDDIAKWKNELENGKDTHASQVIAQKKENNNNSVSPLFSQDTEERKHAMDMYGIKPAAHSIVHSDSLGAIDEQKHKPYNQKY